jgi:hypothetical protein
MRSNSLKMNIWRWYWLNASKELKIGSSFGFGFNKKSLNLSSKTCKVSLGNNLQEWSPQLQSNGQH